MNPLSLITKGLLSTVGEITINTIIELPLNVELNLSESNIDLEVDKESLMSLEIDKEIDLQLDIEPV